MKIIRLLLALLLLLPNSAWAQQPGSLSVTNAQQWQNYLYNTNCLNITSITIANPGIATTNYPHNLNPTATTSVTLAGVLPLALGTTLNTTIVASPITPTTFSTGINTTSLSAYIAGSGYFPNPNYAPQTWNPTSCPYGPALTGVTSETTGLLVKQAPGVLFDFYCVGITAGTSGFCVAYNSASLPSPGALTTSSVIDFCHFSTADGCTVNKIPTIKSFPTGIVVLSTVASSPFTYTVSGSAAIGVDYQ